MQSDLQLGNTWSDSSLKYHLDKKLKWSINVSCCVHIQRLEMDEKWVGEGREEDTNTEEKCEDERERISSLMILK